jgi:uncharacterized protein
MITFILLVFLGLFAGLINSIAGGGAIILFPVLQFLGLPLLMTNATVAASIWPGSLASAIGYKKYLSKLPSRYFLILLPCLVGSLVGANLLKKTPDHILKFVLPSLILLAVILIGLNPKVHDYLYKRKAKSRFKNPLYLIIIGAFSFLIAVYGGYFGAGFGIIILALLGLTSIRNIHALNGLKNLASFCITLTASTYFEYYHLIDWKYAIPIIIGTILGGFFGATFSTKISEQVIRKIIIFVGIIVAAYLFIK